MVAAKKADFETWARKLNISPITARLIRNRGVVSIEDAYMYLEGGPGHSPGLLPDAFDAFYLLREARERGDKIRIVGDYDVDGICASYILETGLTAAGFCADVRLPERVRDGYGLNKSLVDEAIADGCQVLMTCDNGIAAIGEVAYAKEKGMRVIVTDHHEVVRDDAGNDVLPKADAVIDIKRSDSGYGFDGICGAVVAYRFLEYFFMEDIAGETAPYRSEESGAVLQALLPFAALATVCDVMQLVDENRDIVRQGFQAVAASDNAGLKALIHVTGLSEKEITAYHAGFVLGPCLNASGRLDTAIRALSLFETKTEAEAVQIATDLKALNDSRKEMTIRATEEAVSKLRTLEEAGQLPKIIVTYLPDCHESIAGIVAGRVREAFHRPAIILTDAHTEEGEAPLIKGSGRSVPAYDMYDGLSKCADLFVKFGGHKAAAGMTLEQKNLEMLQNRLNAMTSLTEEDLEEVLHIDMTLPLSVLTTDLVREWERLAPFGNGNPTPLFAARSVRLVSGRRIGRDARYGRFTAMDEAGTKAELMYFQDPTKLLAQMEEGTPIHIAFEARINSYRGEESVQLVLKDYLPA